MQQQQYGDKCEYLAFLDLLQLPLAGAVRRRRTALRHPLSMEVAHVGISRKGAIGQKVGCGLASICTKENSSNNVVLQNSINMYYKNNDQKQVHSCVLCKVGVCITC